METTTPPPTEMTEAKTSLRTLNDRITDAILIAIASAIAYLCSFLYERGYASYFGIPQEFINISLINLLIFGAGIVSLLWGVWAFYDVVFPFTRPKHPYLAVRVPFVTGLFLFIVIMPPFVFGWELWVFLFTFGLWFFVVFVTLIWPLIVYRESGSWKERYDKHLVKWLQTDEPVTLQAHIGSRLGNRNLGFVIALGFYSITFINLAGNFKAERQVEFLVTNTTPTMVVLRVYGDNMICAPFDRNTKEVKKSFSIHKVAEDSNFIMNLEKVGPLKPTEKLSLENPTPTPTPTPITSPTLLPTSTPQASPQTTPEAAPEQLPTQ